MDRNVRMTALAFPRASCCFQHESLIANANFAPCRFTTNLTARFMLDLHETADTLSGNRSQLQTIETLSFTHTQTHTGVYGTVVTQRSFFDTDDTGSDETQFEEEEKYDEK